jgi:hypothetical protein
VGFAQQGFAQDVTLTGVWTHSRDAKEKEQAQRYEAIDRAIQDMDGLVRGRARQMLREKTTPLSKISLTDGVDRVAISMQNRRVTFTTDGSPTRVQSERGTATIRAKRQHGQLVVTSQAQNGVQTAVYSVSKDQTRLILDISVSGGRKNQFATGQRSIARPVRHKNSSICLGQLRDECYTQRGQID